MDTTLLNPKNKEQKTVSIKVKNAKLLFKQRMKRIKQLFFNTDIDFIFVFLITLAFVNWTWMARIGFALGVMAVYKIMVKDIMRIKFAGTKK